MRLAAQIISWISLVLLVLPSVMFLSGSMELDRVKQVMLIATLVWFVTASLWMWQDKK